MRWQCSMLMEKWRRLDSDLRLSQISGEST